MTVNVALFARAWIEIDTIDDYAAHGDVALFARAWIEIDVIKLVAG